MDFTAKYPNFEALIKAGFKGDKTTFREEIDILSRLAESAQDSDLAKVIAKATAGAGGRVTTLSATGDVDAFNSQLSSVDDIPIGLNWVKTKVEMKHIVLPDIVKSVIEDFIEEQEHNEKYISNGLSPRNKCMLMGPPGNGKTALAKAIANRMNCPFYFVRYDDLISQRPGETSKRLFAIFEFVKTHRCILFFDEMDAIGKERSDDNEAGEMKRVVSTLLVQLDDVPPHVIVLGATNHPQMLDKAVWRRFHIRITLPNPETDEFEQYLNMTFGRYGHKPETDLRIMALRLEAENFAEVEVFVEDCVRSWIKQDKKCTIDDAIQISIENWPKTRVKIPN